MFYIEILAILFYIKNALNLHNFCMCYMLKGWGFTSVKSRNHLRKKEGAILFIFHKILNFFRDKKG
jgi:hypothetical protein